jgi:hypothetical protein
MPITLPPWLQTSPLDQAQVGTENQRLTLAANAQRAQQAQAQQAFGMDEQRLMQSQHEQEVQNELAKQRMGLATTAAAHAFQAQQDYQKAIEGGMDPVRAAIIHGPAMSGGKMTGFAPVFADWAKTHAPAPPAYKPIPVTDASGKVIGYADKSGAVRYLPIPKPPPQQYETDTTIIKGVPGTKSIPEVPSDEAWYKPWTWGDQAIAAVPATAGTPDQRISRRVPIGAATIPDPSTNQDDPLGLWAK